MDWVCEKCKHKLFRIVSCMPKISCGVSVGEVEIDITCGKCGSSNRVKIYI